MSLVCVDEINASCRILLWSNRGQRSHQSPVPCKASASHKSTLKYYGGLAFGCNVFLRCHTDNDYTMSMVQIHLKGKVKYNIEDDVVVYFCFPTLGVAVPLRPGDFLLFNALIPHCVSSRCRQAEEILSIAMYLKTSVVGMNNNQLPPNSLQTVLADRYRTAIDN